MAGSNRAGRRRRVEPFPHAFLPAVLAVLLTLAASSCAGPTRRHTKTLRLGEYPLHDARRADALGLTPTGSYSQGPPRAGHVARSIAESMPRETREPAVGPPLLPGTPESYGEAIQKEWEPAIRDVWDEVEPASYLEPLEAPRLRLVYVDGPVSFYNEQGREFKEGLNLYLSNRAVARVAERIVFSVEPELAYVENTDSPGDRSDSDWSLRFQELAASGRLGPVELTAGRQPLWWGPGRHGSLLLSNNARPFDMIRLATAEPQLLPGFLGYLGLLQAQLFVSQLERSRTVERPILAGARLSSRLNPWLEVGASRTALFGGKGRKVTGQTILDVITTRGENEPNGPGNQIASLDARVVIPWKVQPFELYGELGGEDEAGGFFSRTAYIAGLYLPRIGPWMWVEATFETADLIPEDRKRRVWYNPGQYPDGYTFRERVIGHHVGTDGRDFFFELRFHPLESATVVLSYDLEEHFHRDPVVERVHQVRVALETQIWRGLRGAVFYAYDRWTNFRQVRGKDREGHAGGVALSWRF